MLQVLRQHRDAFRSQRREYYRRNRNKEPQRDQDDNRNFDRGNNVNIRYAIQQGDRCSRRQSGHEQIEGGRNQSELHPLKIY